MSEPMIHDAHVPLGEAVLTEGEATAQAPPLPADGVVVSRELLFELLGRFALPPGSGAPADTDCAPIATKLIAAVEEIVTPLEISQPMVALRQMAAWDSHTCRPETSDPCATCLARAVLGRFDAEADPDGRAIELAWGLIANAYHGDWASAPPLWRAAAVRWRDDHWHPALDRRHG